jgi:hypothetical protein
MRSARITRFSIGVVAITAAAMLFTGCSSGDSEKDKAAGDGQSSSGATASDGVTEPGSKLKLGEPGVVRYESGEKKTELEVTPASITQGNIADLQKFDLKEDQKNSVPFYVAVRYKNVGSASLKSPVLDGNITGIDDSGQRIPKVILLSSLPACQSADIPEEWAAGATLQSCTAFLVPKGNTLVGVQYGGNYKDQPLTWQK